MAGSVITAGTTRTQAGATQITADITTVNTSTAPNAGTNFGDGIALPQVGAGTDKIFLINNTVNPVQLYTFNTSTDTVNGIAGSNGIAIAPYSTAQIIEANPGAWQCGLDTAPMAGYTANAATSAATLSAASVTSGGATVDVNMTGTLGAGAALTLPTVANMLQSMYSPTLATTFRLRIINSGGGAFSWTVTTNTGWTLNGTMTIAQGTWREFVITVTNVGATPTATIQSVAVGTYS